MKSNDLDVILAQELERYKGKKLNLSEISRRTGISRERLQRWVKDGFKVLPAKKRGRKCGNRKIDEYTSLVDDLLRKNVSNSAVILENLREAGYDGGLTAVKEYVHEHKYLLPPKRTALAPQGNRGRRYETAAGDCYQMDWGFLNVEDEYGNVWRCACFAMVCHHCGFRYVEFFPNAKQENLFIGMIHAFSVMGIPKRVLTDNMKSVATGRDESGNIVYNNTYDAFQKALGFRTDLCKVRHPYTKGAVERLVGFVKANFVQGRTFLNITELNEKVRNWCADKNSLLLKERNCIPLEEHHQEALMLKALPPMEVLLEYLAPLRKISFDGFVEYEGRKYGVPCTYLERQARVLRHSETLSILSRDGKVELSRYPVDWSRKPKICEGQWDVLPAEGGPEEQPTAPVRQVVHIKTPALEDRLSRFANPLAADNGGRSNG